MNIAINTRFLLPHKMEGFGWFTYEVVKRMVEQHPEHHFFFFFDRAFDKKFIFANNVTPIVIHPQARHPILFKIWFDFSITRALKKYNIDVFFSPDGYLSLKTNTKQIAVIHDLNFEHYPNDIPKSARKYLLKYFPLFAKKADKIITVSNFSKEGIINQYDIDKHKIVVAYNGGNENFKPVSDDVKRSIKQQYTNGVDYFVYVGALHERKNINRMFKAFKSFKKRSDSKTKLVVVGENMWRSQKVSTHYEEDIIFTGHLHINELINVVASAKSLILVSYFEGFGIPLVEAMRCGIPVITSNVTSMPEVCGNAGLLVDPFNINEISQAFEKMDVDKDLRNKLAKLSINRAQAFSWQNSSEIIWKEIEKMLSKKL
jgi:glycosyltransferase involved in cell wall biosynthesis